MHTTHNKLIEIHSTDSVLPQSQHLKFDSCSFLTMSNRLVASIFEEFTETSVFIDLVESFKSWTCCCFKTPSQEFNSFSLFSCKRNLTGVPKSSFEIAVAVALAFGAAVVGVGTGTDIDDPVVITSNVLGLTFFMQANDRLI